MELQIKAKSNYRTDLCKTAVDQNMGGLTSDALTLEQLLD